MNTIAEQLSNAKSMLEARNIDLLHYVPAYKSMHPGLSDEKAILGLNIEAAIVAGLDAPYTVDSVASQMANQSGAFPWDGPIGNGLTLAEYRNHWRDSAREKLFVGRLLGLIPQDH